MLMGAWPVLSQPIPPAGDRPGQVPAGKQHVVPLEHRATGAALTEDARYLVVAHEKANLLSIYDIEAGKVLATVKSHSPGVMCCRGDLIFVANKGHGTIGVHSRKAGWKLSGELAVPRKNIGRIDALRGTRYDGRLLVCCWQDSGSDRVVVLVDVQRDECKRLDNSKPLPGDALLDFSGTFVQTSRGLYHAEDYLAGTTRNLGDGWSAGRAGAALPGGAWLSSTGRLSVGMETRRTLGGTWTYDPGADLLYRLDRSGRSMNVMDRANVFKAVATVNLPAGVSMRHVRPIAVTRGGTLHLLTLKSDGLTDLQLPAVKRPPVSVRPALGPEVATPAIRPLQNPACRLFDAADGKNVMLLRDLQLTWLKASDLTTIRSLTLSRLYVKIHERKDYLVAQGDGSVDLLDRETAKLLKRIKLNGGFTMDMACSPEGNSTYVTLLEKRSERFVERRYGVIHHLDEKTGAVTNTKALGWRMAFTSGSALVTWGNSKFHFTGVDMSWRSTRGILGKTLSVRSYLAKGSRLTLKNTSESAAGFIPASAISASRTNVLIATMWDKKVREHFFRLLSPDLSNSTPTRVPRTPVVAVYGKLLASFDRKIGPTLLDLNTGRDVSARLLRAGVLFTSLTQPRFSPDGKYLMGINTRGVSYESLTEQPTLLSMPVLGEGEKP